MRAYPEHTPILFKESSPLEEGLRRTAESFRRQQRGPEHGKKIPMNGPSSTTLKLASAATRAGNEQISRARSSPGHHSLTGYPGRAWSRRWKDEGWRRTL